MNGSTMAPLLLGGIESFLFLADAISRRSDAQTAAAASAAATATSAATSATPTAVGGPGHRRLSLVASRADSPRYGSCKGGLLLSAARSSQRQPAPLEPEFRSGRCSPFGDSRRPPWALRALREPVRQLASSVVVVVC